MRNNWTREETIVAFNVYCKIPFTKIGKHRRILLEDVLQFKELMKEEQKKHLIEMMNLDEEIGLYDS